MARISGFTHIPESFFSIKSASTFTVACALMSYKNNTTGACFPSQQTLAKAANLTRASVSAALKRLKKLGFITWFYDCSSGGATCQYRFFKTDSKFFKASPMFVCASLNPRDKALFLTIHKNLLHGICTLSASQLCEKSPIVSINCVRAGLKSLTKAGLIFITKRNGRSGVISCANQNEASTYINTNPNKHPQQTGFHNNKGQVEASSSVELETTACPKKTSFSKKLINIPPIKEAGQAATTQTAIVSNKAGDREIHQRFNAWVKSERSKNAQFKPAFDVYTFLMYYTPYGKDGDRLQSNAIGESIFFKFRNGNPVCYEYLTQMFRYWQLNGSIFAAKPKRTWKTFFTKKLQQTETIRNDAEWGSE